MSKNMISECDNNLIWSDEYENFIEKDKLILSKHLNKHPNDIKYVLHINGDNKDNSIDNLSESNIDYINSYNQQLLYLALDLVRSKLISFNKKDNKYYLSSKLEIDGMEKSLGFEDVAIKQKKNICKSRLDVDIESEIIKGIKRPIPLIAANMSTVIDSDFYIKLYKAGALGVLHRADSKNNILLAIKAVSKQCDLVAASLGIEEDQFDFAKEMIRNGCNIITIDVAHGYSDVVLDLARKIKNYNSETKLIIGNTTNVDLLHESYKFVDAIKVGIAQGLACETKNTAGCTEKQFSAVLKFKHLSKEYGIPIISDGGIREPADFTKAIAAGANSVMAGSIFAACPESAAEIVYENGHNKKLYAGMASEYVQNKWKGGLKPGTCAEGGVRFLDEGLPLLKLIEQYAGGLKSGITYSGNKCISTFQNNVEFVNIK